MDISRSYEVLSLLLNVNKQELQWNNLPIIDEQPAGPWCVWVGQTVVHQEHQARVHVWGAQETHFQVQRSPLK